LKHAYDSRQADWVDAARQDRVPRPNLDCGVAIFPDVAVLVSRRL